VFVADGRGANSGRGNNSRGTRCSRGLPNKCGACGSLNHIMSSCTTSDDALLKWTLAKRKISFKSMALLVALPLRTLHY
jgi:hypothetical protein